MDNLSSHKQRGVRQAIDPAGADLLYLPPYLNPIELAFSKLKNTASQVGGENNRRPPAPHRNTR